MIPVLAFGDAVGNDILAIRDILAGAGYRTEIYTEAVDRRLPKNSAKSVKRMPALSKNDILIYHACTGAQMNFDLPKYGGKKVMVYHNVTPPEFFHNYSPEIERTQISAYEGMRFLSDKVDYCIADSAYNRDDLLKMGYTCPIDVCPIAIPFGDYDRPVDARLACMYRNDPTTNLLFVGRIAPNKKQEDVIRAFYCYQRRYNPRSRLILVGNSGGMERYESELRAYAEWLGIAGSVVFPGHIRFEEILTYYRAADAFVCMSEHEGFCVPLVEAMYFGVPIIAYRSTAVPETLGEGGLLLDDKDPELAAAVIDRVIRDEALRIRIFESQKQELARFRYEAVRDRFLKCIENIQGL